MGSGSTGKTAMREGFQFIGCEIDEQYAAIARKRIEHEIKKMVEAVIGNDQLDLFGTA
jgi:site-specific DNA-methyltransferase (adenine-specific)